MTSDKSDPTVYVYTYVLTGVFVCVAVCVFLGVYVGISVCTSVFCLPGCQGNKGGVAVRLKVHETSMVFVNSHLAAHMDEVEKRNSDYRNCLLRLAPGGREISQHE